MNLQLVSLDSLSVKIDYGFTASAVENTDGPKFLRITDLQNNSVNWNLVPSYYSNNKNVNKYLLEKGDIVFARTGATTGKSYLLTEPPDESIFASYLIRVRPNEKVVPSYLSYFFKSTKYWQQINFMANGAAQPGVNSTKLRELIVPVLPLPEQKKIAEILDAADSLRQKDQQLINHYNTLSQSLFLHMFGDTVTNPMSWDQLHLGDVLNLITYGLTVRPKYHEEGIPLISAREIRTGIVSLERAPKISKEDFDKLSAKGKPLKGDILFSKTGSIGHCAVVTTGKRFAITQNAARLSFKDNITRTYAIYFLRSQYFQIESQRRAKGNAVKDLQLGDMKMFKFLMPPLELQNKFAELIESVELQKLKAQASLQKSEDLFNSLLQRAFKGELSS